VEQVDVMIVGAGLSGIGAACHLQKSCPGKSWAILEARGAIGGTWDLFRYPGVRSDSDMFTLGYSFRPWSGPRAIVDGATILEYVRSTAREHGVDRGIRFGRRVLSASWSSRDAAWTVEAERAESGERERFVCRFLFLCSGYYRYDAGYTPAFRGAERFRGRIVHPQAWPEDLDYTGSRVVVVGSGATAVTLIPAMAERAAHVTMLQRSPTYILPLPGADALAGALGTFLPAGWSYRLTRGKNVLLTLLIYWPARRRPEQVKRLLQRMVRKELGPGYDIDTHFSPRYEPWDQRLCLAPDGDLFQAIRRGRASVVTDGIDVFTETGIRLSSGRELPADLIVTATGLNLLPLGGVRFSVDGQEVDLSETLAYRGMMLGGVPNLAFAVGYTNASWTLKSELACQRVCRLLNYMDRRGYRWCMPAEEDPPGKRAPLFDLTAGYVLRSIDRFPKQGARAPWRVDQNYLRDVWSMRAARIDDGILRFSRA